MYIKWQNTIESLFLKELMLIKHVRQKNAIFVTISILNILVLGMNHIFAMFVLI